MNPPDLNQPVDQAKANYSNLQGIFGQQRGETSDYLNRYSGAIKGLESIPGMANRIGNELGVPQLRNNAQSLNQTLSDLPQTYNSATRGFDVNANQLARTIGQKQYELAPLAEKATQQFQNAQEQLGTQMGYTQAQQNRSLLPYQSEQSLMSDRLARETTGYSQSMQSELDAISQKVQNGITLSEGEKNRAQQLLVAEKGYQSQMDLQKQQQGYASSQPNYTPIQGGLYDTTTGSWKVRPPLTNAFM